MKKTLQELVYRLRKRAAQYHSMSEMRNLPPNEIAEDKSIMMALSEVADCIEEALAKGDTDDN